MSKKPCSRSFGDNSEQNTGSPSKAGTQCQAMRPRPSISALMVPLPMMPRSRFDCCGRERIRSAFLCASRSDAICLAGIGLAGLAFSLSRPDGFDFAFPGDADFEDAFVAPDLTCFDLLEDFAALATADSLSWMEILSVRPKPGELMFAWWLDASPLTSTARVRPAHPAM